MFKKEWLVAVAVFMMCEGTALAAHPLVTDDSGTQGRQKFQLELNAQYGREASGGIVQYTTPTASTITYGIADTLDVSIGVPYIFVRIKDAHTEHIDGLGDAVVSLKWRFYERDGLSFAVKPGITLPTGNESKQLGTGKPGASLFFIGTKEVSPWAFHLNLGYIENDNRLDQRVSLWHASAAAELRITQSLKAVANAGVQRNTDKQSSGNPAFLLGGVIWTLSPHLDFDAGYKYGITRPETDHTIMAGLTFRF